MVFVEGCFLVCISVVKLVFKSINSWNSDDHKHITGKDFYIVIAHETVSLYGHAIISEWVHRPWVNKLYEVMSKQIYEIKNQWVYEDE